jgi:tetratricopeptide (TPR) repeat protein
MRLDPSLPEAPYTLGVVLWQTGRADEAVASFREALSRRPDDANAHFMLGTVLKHKADVEGALAAFREAIRQRPDLAEAHLNLGQLLQQSGDAAGAALALAEADRLNKKKADAQAATFALDAGLTKLKKRDTAGALESFREAIRLSPEHAKAHYQLALALQSQGAVEEARHHFTEARRLAPYLTPPEPTQ